MKYRYKSELGFVFVQVCKILSIDNPLSIDEITDEMQKKFPNKKREELKSEIESMISGFKDDGKVKEV
jgi:hypothetical protein